MYTTDTSMKMKCCLCLSECVDERFGKRLTRNVAWFGSWLGHEDSLSQPKYYSRERILSYDKNTFYTSKFHTHIKISTTLLQSCFPNEDFTSEHGNY